MWKEAAEHRATWESDPELYALSSIAEGVPVEQRARALFVVLGSSWANLSAGARETVSRVARLLLAALPAEDVLTVMLALRRGRANHKHTARAILRWLTEHPQMYELALTRSSALRDLVEHAAGRSAIRSALERLSSAPSVEAIELPHVRDEARAASLLRLVFRRALRAGHDGLGARDRVRSLSGVAVDTHLRYANGLDAHRDAPKTVTATNRGDIAATLVHLARGGPNAELERALVRYVDAKASELTAFDGSIAIVLDASLSSRGYGERELALFSQSVALTLVLQRVAARVEVVVVGDDAAGRMFGATSWLPRPVGVSDLARGLLEAARRDTDVIAIVTDGYENTAAGDLADVARALPTVNITTPIVVCQSKFTAKDDMTLRRPAPDIAEIGFWHEDDFAEVLLNLTTRTHPAMAATSLRRALEARLTGLTRELEPWTSAP